MSRRKANLLYAPEGTCRSCGFTGQDWGFKYHWNYCSKCYEKWKKQQRAERKKMRTNENINITDDIIVTENVKKRLHKKANTAIPFSKKFNIIRVSKDAFRDNTKGGNIEISIKYKNIYETQFSEKLNIEIDQRTKENLAAQKIPFPDSVGYYLEHIEEQLKFINKEISQIKDYQGHMAKKSGFIPGISAPA